MMQNRFGHTYDFDGMVEVSERELYELYDEMLDDIFGTVKVADYIYMTSKALKLLDPTAYHCGFNDWFDAEVTDERYVEDDDGKIYIP